MNGFRSFSTSRIRILVFSRNIKAENERKTRLPCLSQVMAVLPGLNISRASIFLPILLATQGVHGLCLWPHAFPAHSVNLLSLISSGSSVDGFNIHGYRSGVSGRLQYSLSNSQWESRNEMSVTAA